MDVQKLVTRTGCTLTVAKDGDQTILHGRMEQDGDGRYFEVLLNATEALWLAYALPGAKKKSSPWTWPLIALGVLCTLVLGGTVLAIWLGPS